MGCHCLLRSSRKRIKSSSVVVPWISLTTIFKLLSTIVYVPFGFIPKRSLLIIKHHNVLSVPHSELNSGN